MEYYEKSYNIRIKDPNQPMLLSKPKKRDLRRGSGMIYLVPELCVMTGLTDEMRQDFNMMRDLSHYMRMTPDKRVATLLRFNQDLSSSKPIKDEMQNWGLKIATDLVQVQGRILPPETICQGEKVITFDQKSSDWSRETRSLKLHSAISLKNWAMVFTSRSNEDARELSTTLQRVGPPMGMSIASPRNICLRGDSTPEFVGVLNDLSGFQLVLVILPNNRLDRYSAIKRHLTVKMGVPSQCVLSRTLFKKQRLMSVATKIAIQMNCKLGGEPWKVNVPIKLAMVIGYDTYHDKRTRGASYGGIVSSINQSWTRYFSQVSQHRNQEELTNNFATGVKNALAKFVEFNGATPQYVLVYRDGVGEGQIEYVKEHEIQAIKQCFETCKINPKFAFIIVSKRITTRIMSDMRGRPDNPSPGTVVDDVITLPERYDFYLISQSVNQGTVSPTSFNIIDDSTGLRPDYMQRLAYKLTHMYFNWQGTVRVPAPCQFAHKLAYLTGQSINAPAHRDLMDLLWYL
ncbi:piwi-like protein Siwi [Macrobrachium nipponense]|uniref:piwi-like protein Siwi n=1 Tax=Macrobrachium nipponense TaxID=159736 RepID=UPI0030C87ED2